jgi:hypothetical protein
VWIGRRNGVVVDGSEWSGSICKQIKRDRVYDANVHFVFPSLPHLTASDHSLLAERKSHSQRTSLCFFRHVHAYNLNHQAFSSLCPINDVTLTSTILIRAAVGPACQVHQGTRHRMLKMNFGYIQCCIACDDANSCHDLLYLLEKKQPRVLADGAFES